MGSRRPHVLAALAASVVPLLAALPPAAAERVVTVGCELVQPPDALCVAIDLVDAFLPVVILPSNLRLLPPVPILEVAGWVQHHTFPSPLGGTLHLDCVILRLDAGHAQTLDPCLDAGGTRSGAAVPLFSAAPGTRGVDFDLVTVVHVWDARLTVLVGGNGVTGFPFFILDPTEVDLGCVTCPLRA